MSEDLTDYKHDAVFDFTYFCKFIRTLAHSKFAH